VAIDENADGDLILLYSSGCIGIWRFSLEKLFQDLENWKKYHGDGTQHRDVKLLFDNV
jgi:hypothetical protein